MTIIFHLRKFMISRFDASHMTETSSTCLLVHCEFSRHGHYTDFAPGSVTSIYQIFHWIFWMFSGYLDLSENDFRFVRIQSHTSSSCQGDESWSIPDLLLAFATPFSETNGPGSEKSVMKGKKKINPDSNAWSQVSPQVLPPRHLHTHTGYENKTSVQSAVSVL